MGLLRRNGFAPTVVALSISFTVIYVPVVTFAIPRSRRIILAGIAAAATIAWIRRPFPRAAGDVGWRRLVRTRLKTVGVYQPERLGLPIRIGINPTSQPNGITLNVPTTVGPVVPEAVLMKPRFLVEVLSGEPKREFECAQPARVFIRRVSAERLGVIVAPDGGTRRIRDQSWRVEVIGVAKPTTRLNQVELLTSFSPRQQY